MNKPISASKTTQAAPLTAESVSAPGYTPSVRQVPRLVALLGASDDDPEGALATTIERALVRLGDKLLPAIEREFSAAPARARVHLLRALGRLPADEGSVAFFSIALEDEEPRVRRAAARGLGKARGPIAKEAEASLLAAWHRGGARMDGPEQRALIDALGKLGAQDALALVEGSTAGTQADAQLERVAARSKMRIERSVRRRAGGRIVPERRIDRAVPIVFHVRAGLGPILETELAEVLAPPSTERGTRSRGHVARDETRVVARLEGSLEQARLPRVALSFGFPVGRRRFDDERALERGIAELLASEDARRIFSTWTEGTVRYRLSFRGGGHRRALVFRIAGAVTALAPDLLNDPTESLWDVVVDDGVRAGADGARAVSLELVPRALEDTRFAYRRTDVPAASHPTIAAALARVAEVRSTDIVWDPFVGSGTELVECARRGSPAALFGTDVDARALAAARENLAAAGVRATLEPRSALAFAPRGVTRIVTNPPMGLRVERTKELGEMLERFVAHAGETLARGGRLVWLSPFASRLRPRAEASGLALDLAREVDMGGFSATLEVWRKR